jgi:hypothetical protein
MPNSNRFVRESLVVGLIGYATVAVFYAVFDVLAARGTLYTVNLLGRTVFRGLRDPSVLRMPVQTDMTAIFLFNGLHLVASLAIGFVVCWLVLQAETSHVWGRPALLTIVAGFFVTIFGIGMLSSPIRNMLPWWSVVAANALAVVVAASYLLRHHPTLFHRRPVSMA